MQKRSASLDGYDAVAMNAESGRSIDPADVRTAHKNGKLTVIQGVEGAPFLQGYLERVKQASKWV